MYFLAHVTMSRGTYSTRIRQEIRFTVGVLSQSANRVFLRLIQCAVGSSPVVLHVLMSSVRVGVGEHTALEKSLSLSGQADFL